MRKLFLLSTFAALLATTGLARAQQKSLFKERFCARVMNSETSSFTNCRFHTLEQCLASARGYDRSCTTNPWWHGPRQPTTQGKSGPHS